MSQDIAICNTRVIGQEGDYSQKTSDYNKIYTNSLCGIDVVSTQPETIGAHQAKIEEKTGEVIMGLRKKSERIMLAITFAEAGDHETAREFLREGKVLRQRKRLISRPRPRKELRAPSSRRR